MYLHAISGKSLQCPAVRRSFHQELVIFSGIDIISMRVCAV